PPSGTPPPSSAAGTDFPRHQLHLRYTCSGSPFGRDPPVHVLGLALRARPSGRAVPPDFIVFTLVLLTGRASALSSFGPVRPASGHVSSSHESRPETLLLRSSRRAARCFAGRRSKGVSAGGAQESSGPQSGRL